MARGLKTFVALCVFIVGLSQLCLAVSIQHYEYDQRSEGWWRLHSKPAAWLEAKLRCQFEGGFLASPTTVSLTSSMTLKMGEIRSVFTGIHANSSGGDFVTTDGIPVSNVSTPRARGEPNRLGEVGGCLAMSNAGELADVSCISELPYFCYKSTAAMAENVCGTNHGYTLELRTGSCYKYHGAVLSWHRAAMKCASERAHLAVINNEEESQVLGNLLERHSPYSISGEDLAHIGVLDLDKSGNWLTVFGQTLSEAGFHRWNRGPNDVVRDTVAWYCGSVSRDGNLNASPCFNKDMPFICEITPPP